MAKSAPRLYQILVSDKNEEDTKTRGEDEIRGFPGFSAFQRISRGIRTSFRRIKSLRSRISRGKTFLSNKDSGYETEARTQDNLDCDSLDSGLDSDHSLDLSLLIKDKSDQSLRLRDESSTSIDITRKSSNRSSRTIDSGIVSRTSPGCLVTHRITNVPKKKVSILLPGENRKSAPFGHQFQVETTRFSRAKAPTTVEHIESVSLQRSGLVTRAMHDLQSIHPHLCDTIFILFDPEPNLYSLNSEEIGSLMYDLRSILYESLRSVVYFEVILFLIQHFLLQVSSVLQHIPSMGPFPALIRDLITKSERLGYSRQSFLLKETQTLYIQLWCSLLD